MCHVMLIEISFFHGKSKAFYDESFLKSKGSSLIYHLAHFGFHRSSLD